MIPMLLPRRAVERMAPYSPPTAGREGKLRLDFNENTIGCSPRVLATLKRSLSREKLAVYPEYEEARKKIAAFFGVPFGHLLFTNGTDEAIQVLINTYVDAGDRVLILSPSYAMLGLSLTRGTPLIQSVSSRRGSPASGRDE